MAEIEKLLAAARMAREEQNYDDAKKYYGMVKFEDPSIAEARFFHAYYTLMSGTQGEVFDNLVTLEKVLSSIPKILVNSNEENKESLLKEMAEALFPLPEFIKQVQRDIGGPVSEPSRIIRNAIIDFADAIEQYFPTLAQTLSVECWKNVVNSNKFGLSFEKEPAERCLPKIRKYEPNYEPPKKEEPLSQGIGCTVKKPTND